MSEAQSPPAPKTQLPEVGSPETPAPDFDGIARAYRWLEYLTFGTLLEQTRTHFLPELARCRRALVLGDGDGRFLARLLRENPRLEADAVDTSAAMLSLLRRRAGDSAARLTTHRRNALGYTPARPPDLVVTHFFLDCLTQPELDRLAKQLAPFLPPGALWLVSEFRIPDGALRRPAQGFIRLLYAAFRALTGLRTTHLPNHAASLGRHGLIRIACEHRLCGLLASELWRRQDTAHPISSGVP